MLFAGYETGDWYDELFDAEGRPRPEAEMLIRIIESQPEGEFGRLQETANAALVNLGITFNVYSDGAGVERVLPFDIVPRIVRSSDWDRIERGLRQRIYALNLFLLDVYNDGKILRDGVVPLSWCYRRLHIVRLAWAFTRRRASGATSPAPT